MDFKEENGVGYWRVRGADTWTPFKNSSLKMWTKSFSYKNDNENTKVSFVFNDSKWQNFPNIGDGSNDFTYAFKDIYLDINSIKMISFRLSFPGSLRMSRGKDSSNNTVYQYIDRVASVSYFDGTTTMTRRFTSFSIDNYATTSTSSQGISVELNVYSDRLKLSFLKFGNGSTSGGRNLGMIKAADMSLEIGIIYE